MKDGQGDISGPIDVTSPQSPTNLSHSPSSNYNNAASSACSMQFGGLKRKSTVSYCDNNVDAAEANDSKLANGSARENYAMKTFDGIRARTFEEVWFQNRRAKWRRQEKSESLRLGLTHFTQLPHRLGCGAGGLPVDPWLSPPLLSALPGFLSHPQTVYPSYLTPPLSLAPSNLTMSSLAAMGHGPHGPAMHPSPHTGHPGAPPPPSVLSAAGHPGHHVQLSHLSPHLSRMSPQSLATMPPQLSSSTPTSSISSSSVSSSSMTSAIANAVAPASIPSSGVGLAALSPLSSSISALPPPLAAASSATALNSSSPPPPRATPATNSEQSPQNLTTNNDANEAMLVGSNGGNGNGSSKCSAAASMELLDVGRDSPPPGHALSSNVSANAISRQSPISASQPQTADIRSNSIATLRIKAKEHLESINKGLAMV
ncbi:retinal homeobox protein Rx [Rhagoletis pomonella]|uniref:retinal homeobox protein Rx n=1 Tax=Rhagoletis pomonella TaxID=28610 RepID=UPI00177E0E38|nr:retinal homeobox protein Rx [Rhagoletis pomonella]